MNLIVEMGKCRILLEAIRAAAPKNKVLKPYGLQGINRGFRRVRCKIM